MNYIWFGIVTLLSLIEIITVDLVAIWFIISGIIVILLSAYVESFFIQFILFILIGIIPLFVLRPYVKKYLTRIKVKNNMKFLINKVGIVTKEVNESEGEMEINNNIWPVKASKKIKVGSKVKIDSIKNFTIYVSEEKSNKKKK